MKRHMLAWVTALIAGGAAPVHGQLEMMTPPEAPTVGLQASKTLVDGDGLEWYTSVLRARLLAPLGPTTTLMVDWGLSVAGTEFSGADGTTSNPEIGLLFGNEDGRSSGYASIVVPVSFGFGDNGVSVATGFLDNALRPERFAPDLFAVTAGLTPSIETAGTPVVNFEIGGAAWIPTGDNTGDTEVVARYAGGASAELESVRIRGDLEGMAILSEADLDFGERTLHQLLFSLSGVNGGPSVFVRVPLEDGLDATLGVAIPLGLK